MFWNDFCSTTPIPFVNCCKFKNHSGFRSLINLRNYVLWNTGKQVYEAAKTLKGFRTCTQSRTIQRLLDENRTRKSCWSADALRIVYNLVMNYFSGFFYFTLLFTLQLEWTRSHGCHLRWSLNPLTIALVNAIFFIT